MSKITTYTVVMVGTLVLLSLAGIVTTSDGLLSQLGVDSLGNWDTSGFITKILEALAAAVAVGVVVGYLTKQSGESYIVAGLATSLTYWFLTDIYKLYNTMLVTCPVGSDCAWASYVIFLLVVPYLAAFGISIISWWRGAD